MSEQQIKDGYEQMGSMLVPPGDTLERVDRAVRIRRRRRMATTTGAVMATALVAGGIAWALQDGDGGTGTIVANDPPPPPPLTLTRADGSTYAFTDVTVSCDPPPGIDARDTLGSGNDRIWLFSPMRLEGSSQATDDDAVLTEPFLYLEGRVDEIDGKTFTLPHDPGSSSARALTLFVADGRGEPHANEVSSAEAGAGGTVHVLEAACDPTPVLQLVVDTTLGSEVGQDTEKLAGTYR